MSNIFFYALRRFSQTIPVIFFIMVGSFLLLQLAPGDMVDALVGDMGGADPQFIARLRLEYGLDQPVYIQLWRYLAKLVVFDFGWSYVYEQPVLTVLLNRLVPTLALMSTALFCAFLFGIALGAWAAYKAYSLSDNIISILGLFFYALPSFFLAILMIMVFALYFGWLPAGGYRDVVAFHTGWRHVLDIGVHLILPAASLALIYLAFYMRLMRTSILEVSELDYVRTARAKGVSGARLMFHHIMRNALLPVVTLLGLQFSTILGGSVVIEYMFSIPGLGQLAYSSVIKRDMNTLMGIVFFCSIMVIIINFITDVVYARLDSRIELS